MQPPLAGCCGRAPIVRGALPLLTALSLSLPMPVRSTHEEYTCPANSQAIVSHPFYLGDCECAYGHVKQAGKCVYSMTPYWMIYCGCCIAIPILYYLWVYPPPKPILVWMVYKWRQLRSDATEGVHFCMFGSDLWPRITIAFSYLSILLVPFNACCCCLRAIGFVSRNALAFRTALAVPAPRSIPPSALRTQFWLSIDVERFLTLS